MATLSTGQRGPIIVCTSGSMKSGKSTINRGLAEKLRGRGHEVCLMPARQFHIDQIVKFDGVVFLEGQASITELGYWTDTVFRPRLVLHFAISTRPETVASRCPGTVVPDPLTIPSPTSHVINNDGDLFAAVNAMDVALVDAMPSLGPRATVMSGPSGVGKGTVVHRVRELMPQLQRVRSVTTRARRPDEGDEEYDFASRDEFQRLLEAGDLVEHAEYAGNCYGSLRSSAVGPWRLFEIEAKGAAQVKAAMPEATLIRIEPPGETLDEKLDELKRRLENDTANPRNDIPARLERAPEELASYADRIVINKTIEDAAREIAWSI